MSVAILTTSDGLTRSGTYLNTISALWHVDGWVNPVALPTGSQYIPIWIYGDPALTDPYIGLFLTPAGSQLRVWDGSTLTQSVALPLGYAANAWNSFRINYNSGTHHLTIFGKSNGDDLTIDLSTIVFVAKDETIGYDTSGSGDRIAGLRVLNIRTLQAVFQSGIGEQISTTSFQTFLGLFGGGEYSNTPLNSDADLSDVGTHNHDWSAIGSLDTYTPGPLSLNNGSNFIGKFEAGNFNTWSYNEFGADSSPTGCNGDTALGCGFANDSYGLGQYFDPNYTEGTIKFQSTVFTSTDTRIFKVAYLTQSNYLGSFLGFGFSFNVDVHADGSISVETLSGTTTSAASVFPVDGLRTAVQITWIIDPSNIRVDVYVNNVLVVHKTGSSAGYTYKAWSGFEFYAPQVFSYASVDNIVFTPIVDDISTYNPCDSAKVIACGYPSPPLTGVYQLIEGQRYDEYYLSYDPATTEQRKIP